MTPTGLTYTTTPSGLLMTPVRNMYAMTPQVVIGQIQYPDGSIRDVVNMPSYEPPMGPSEYAVRQELQAAQIKLAQAIHANEVLSLQLQATQQLLQRCRGEIEQLRQQSQGHQPQMQSPRTQKRPLRRRDFKPLKPIPEKEDEKFNLQFGESKEKTKILYATKQTVLTMQFS